MVAELLPLDGATLVEQRQAKYLAMGKKTLN